MQEPSQTRHYSIYRGWTAVTKAIYMLTQQSWSAHLLTKLAGWFKQHPGPEVWAALLPHTRCSSTLSQIPEQPVERKCMKAATKLSIHKEYKGIRGISTHCEEDISNLEIISMIPFYCSAKVRLPSLPCKAHEHRRGHRAVHQSRWDPSHSPESQRSKGSSGHNPTTHVSPYLPWHWHQPSSLAVPWHKVLISCYQCPNLPFFTEHVLYIWQASLKQTPLVWREILKYLPHLMKTQWSKSLPSIPQWNSLSFTMDTIWLPIKKWKQNSIQY